MFRAITPDNRTRKERHQETRFERTQEWVYLKEKLDAGLSPDEGYEVEFTNEEVERHGLPDNRAIRKFLKRYTHGKPYAVRTIRKSGSVVYQVQHPVDDLIATRKRAKGQLA